MISFRDVEACGTSTAVSVPCMFSIYDASDYSDSKGKSTENLLETAMLYRSDHGESLGEHDLWLHGMPKAIAPGEQTRAASIFWVGKHFEPADAAAVRSRQGQVISHHNLFHTVLGMMEIGTQAYDPELDLRRSAQQPVSSGNV